MKGILQRCVTGIRAGLASFPRVRLCSRARDWATNGAVHWGSGDRIGRGPSSMIRCQSRTGVQRTHCAHRRRAGAGSVPVPGAGVRVWARRGGAGSVSVPGSGVWVGVWAGRDGAGCVPLPGAGVRVWAPHWRVILGGRVLFNVRRGRGGVLLRPWTEPVLCGLGFGIGIWFWIWGGFFS